LSKKNREYWEKRSEQVQESLLNKSDTYYDDLDRIYKMANMDIQKEIDAWYRRFAKNNCISYLDAKKLLTSNELKEFKWTVQDYIKYGEKNAINQNWMEELENASVKVHISRLEALQVQLQQRMEVLFHNQIDDVDKLVKGIYTDGYYHTAFELQKGFNTGFNLQAFNNNELEKIVSKPWTTDGTNFSKRIWGEYRPELVNVVHTQLTQTLIRGIPPDRAIKTIAEKFNTTKSRAGNLVMTESAYFSSLSRQDCYNDLNVGEYEIVATLDFKTSVICRHLDGEHFPLSDYKVWVTAPPFHNRCRTTTCPYFNDEFTLGEKRAARGIDGKTEYVDGNIKYEDWHSKYIKNNPNALVDEKKIKNESTDRKQHEEYKKILSDEIPKSFDKFQELKYNNSNEWTTMKDYHKARTKGNISSFSSYSDYKSVKQELADKLVGIKTSDDIEIKSFSKHMIDRILGASNDPKTGFPRSGTTVDGVLDALRNPIQITETKARKLDKVAETSKKYVGETTTVSINPNTGNLIQSNPTDKDKVRRLKNV